MTATREDVAPGDLVDPPDDSFAMARRHSGLLLVAIITVLALLTWVIAFSPVLGVRQIEIKGVTTATRAQVQAAAQIKHGQPLVRLNTGAIVRRIEKVPTVADATVSISYPSTVIITITERKAVGYLTVGTSFVLVDLTGRKYLTVAAAPKIPHLVAAGDLADDQGAIAALATVAAALPPKLAALVGIVTATTSAHVALLLRDGRSIIWGDATRSADKARDALALLGRPGTTFDVSNPDQVFAH